MFGTCGDVQRLLSHHNVLRNIAHRALSAAPASHLHQSLAHLATRDHLSTAFSRTQLSHIQHSRSRTLCTMSEVAHAPPQAENGAAETDVEALRKHIAELQVRLHHSQINWSHRY